MFLRPYRAVEFFALRDFLEQLRAANQRFRGELTGIEGPDQQLEQTRMGHQEFEEQTAQTVGFDESKKIIQRCVGIGRLRQALE